MIINCYHNTCKGYECERRVQVPAYADCWMQGDRYGLVVRHDQSGATRVLLDKSGRTLTFLDDELTYI